MKNSVVVEVDCRTGKVIDTKDNNSAGLINAEHFLWTVAGIFLLFAIFLHFFLKWLLKKNPQFFGSEKDDE